MPMRWKICVISLMNAMLMSRCAFSITFAASAVLDVARAEDAAGDGAVDAASAARRLRRLPGHHLGDALDRVLLSPGLMRSGE
jgi:hypothetical protein